MVAPALLAATLAAAEFPAIELERFAQGLNAPVAIAHAGDGTSRLFVAEQAGRIRILRRGTLLDAPFLDITDRVNCCGERGLLGLAFPPRFKDTGRFYVYYTDAPGDLILSRFQVSAADPDRADPASESILLAIPHREYENHNGGNLAFGPDGFLYIGPGDGGGGGDSLASGQNLATLLGKLLRLDVESGVAPYAIPESNPFAALPGARPEIWAYGLRNPWRFSFDRLTGDLYIADVGQERWEEIDFQPAASPGGENYGWNIREAAECYESTQCRETGLTPPIAQYDHETGGCSVTGGFVYRGLRYPALAGLYFYGDYCNGKIWALQRDGEAWQTRLLLEARMGISTFGEDEDGEVYVAAQDQGVIYAIRVAAPASPLGPRPHLQAELPPLGRLLPPPDFVRRLWNRLR